MLSRVSPLLMLSWDRRRAGDVCLHEGDRQSVREEGEELSRMEGESMMVQVVVGCTDTDG